MEFLENFFMVVGLVVTLFAAIVMLLVLSGTVKVGIKREESDE